MKATNEAAEQTIQMGRRAGKTQAALDDFRRQLREEHGVDVDGPRRPSKLARAVMRTAVAKGVGPSSFERTHGYGKRRIRGVTERGPCQVFDRGPALTNAIVKAERRGRVQS